MLEEQATDDPADEYLFFGETLSRARSDRDLSTSASPPPLKFLCRHSGPREDVLRFLDFVIALSYDMTQ